MNNIVIKAKEEIRKLSENNEKNKVTTAEIRKTAAKLFKETEDKSADNVFALCEELLRERDGALSCIAYDMAYRVKAQYTFKTFDVFY